MELVWFIIVLGILGCILIVISEASPDILTRVLNARLDTPKKANPTKGFAVLLVPEIETTVMIPVPKDYICNPLPDDNSRLIAMLQEANWSGRTAHLDNVPGEIKRINENLVQFFEEDNRVEVHTYDDRIELRTFGPRGGKKLEIDVATSDLLRSLVELDIIKEDTNE